MTVWGLIECEGESVKLTQLGRTYARDEEGRPIILQEILRGVRAYRTALEWINVRKFESVTASDVGAHWVEHNKEEVADASDTSLKNMAAVFFELAQGAGLGIRKRAGRARPAHLLVDATALQDFIVKVPAQPEEATVEDLQAATPEASEAPARITKGQIFIAHGSNMQPVEQLKKILDRFHVPYKTAKEEPHRGRPVPQKVKDVMEQCTAAIFVFTADMKVLTDDGGEQWWPRENVPHELGAASYLYGNRIVIFKEDKVTLASNFSDLGYIEFEPDELAGKAMDLISELVGLGLLEVSVPRGS